MTQWQGIADISPKDGVRIERLRLPHKGIAIEGDFELPPLAALSQDDQVFIMLFLHAHGSIKQMEKAFGISYPTVKNRLRRIAEQLPLVEAAPEPVTSEVLDQLAAGEISVDQALKALQS